MPPPLAKELRRNRWAGILFRTDPTRRPTRRKEIRHVGRGSGVAYRRKRLNRAGLNVEAICEARSTGLT